MTATTPAGPERLTFRAALRRALRDRHFVIASIVLAVAAAGWGATVRLLEWATEKQPVTWPRAVQVDPETRRLITFPDVLGETYRLHADQGDHVLSDIDLHLLGMKTGYDNAERVSRRQSNWYVSRTYVDTRPEATWRTWRLSVYYYTGGLDKVPHVPERCAVAAGARWLGSTDIRLPSLAAPPAWAKGLQACRALFAQAQEQSVEYYLFSLNGVPKTDWKVVRGTLSLPWVRHCYFAKIQFAPIGPVSDLAEADQAAAEFAQACLPEVLRMLPTEQDVRDQDDAD